MQPFELYDPRKFPDPVVYFVPFFVLLIALEYFLYLKNKHLERKDYLEGISSIGMGLGSMLIDIIMKAVALGYLFWFYQFGIFKNILSPANLEDFFTIQWHIQNWWVWILVMFGQDFCFYWHHRLSHEIRVLWSGHINHHSSVKLNLATALRQGWIELLYKDMFYIPLAILGFNPIMIMMMHQFNLLFQFWVHTEAINKMGWFEKIFNTPSHHRVHHATNIEYLDKNYAGIFIIWDKMLGTFKEENKATNQPIYGITKNIETYNLFEIAFHEAKAIFKDVKNAPTLKAKLNYMFNSPGWSHNGEDLRAKTLQKNLNKEIQ